ncbi:transposase [Propionibacterium freudenreichii]|uniref:transposase n=1 Tax=Propionibacterium freudenreichii TaxID=1744 RepID=UPI002551B4CE|nr:transposase [Propionibacterium freudenreichii]MDK9659725.1 transposase [Propionibacterium freudenreichii]
MSGSKYSPEFKNQVVLEVVDKHRTIKAVAESYNLVDQTVGVWVKEYRKKNPDPETENLTSAESAELERLRKDLREARMENEFLKKRQPSSRRNHSSCPLHVHLLARRQLPRSAHVPMPHRVSLGIL